MHGSAGDAGVAAVQVEAGDRVCGISLKAVGNSSPPSTMAYLAPSLVFLGSWLGHSNLVSFEFKSTEAAPSPRGRAASPPSPSSTVLSHRVDTAAVTPLPTCTADPAAAADGEPGAAADGGDGVDMAAAAAAAGQDAAAAGAMDDAAETGGAGLDALVSIMQDAEAAPVADAAADEAGEGAGVRKRPRETEGGSAVPDAAPKLAKIEDEAAAAAAPQAPEPESPRPGMLPGLPFAGLMSAPVPGLPGLPGLGAAAGAPGLGAATSSQVLTEGPEAPLEEGGAKSSDDDSDLEAALYQCAAPFPAHCRSCVCPLDGVRVHAWAMASQNAIGSNRHNSIWYGCTRMGCHHTT